MDDNMMICNFDYSLPSERIAKEPLAERDKSNLLIYDRGKISQDVFASLPDLIDKDTFLVFNDTKVVHARVFFEKETGTLIEIFCLEAVEDTDGEYKPCDIQLAFAKKHNIIWRCFIGNNKRWKRGTLTKEIMVKGHPLVLKIDRIGNDGDSHFVEFSWDRAISFSQVLQAAGVVPLPPYINREACEKDEVDYQTVYALHEGSVAAPTAGLHFTDRTFDALKSKEIKYDFITLHVGAGTFKPVTEEIILNHKMHPERMVIRRSMIENLLEYCEGNVLCVGTTSVRTIESLYWYGVQIIENRGKYSEMDVRQWQAYTKTPDNISATKALQAIIILMKRKKFDVFIGKTQLMITPPYKYRIVKQMVTNFHMPKSSLLLLIAAFIGEDWKEVYKYALDNDFRFLSYGDACLLSKKNE